MFLIIFFILKLVLLYMNKLNNPKDNKAKKYKLPSIFNNEIKHIIWEKNRIIKVVEGSSKPLFNNLWWRWFLSGKNIEIDFLILEMMTKIISKIGIKKINKWWKIEKSDFIMDISFVWKQFKLIIARE